MTSPPAWLDQLDLRHGPPWLSMGTHALDLEDWLVVDDRHPAELALKLDLLGARPTEVLATSTGSEAASAEALALVRAWLDAHDHPIPAVAEGLHPIDEAGRLVQEDLCLMERQAEGWVLTAASVCFPSHWRIADKMGRSLGQIHAPVHHYAEELERRVDTFFDRMRVERPVWRRNLSIHSHPDLFSPEPHEQPESFGPDIDDVWLRSEYQTLRRLPTSGAVLFTIKTQVCPASVLAERPVAAHALATRLQALAPQLVELGQPVPFPVWLPTWLEAC